MSSKKMTRAEIIELISMRNEFTGHTTKEDTARIRMPKAATDDELRAALDAALTADFNEDFGGKDMSKLPANLIKYMSDVLGLAGEDEEEEAVEVDDDEEEEIDVDDEDGDADEDEDEDEEDDDVDVDDADEDEDDEVEVEDEDEDDEPELDDEQPEVAKSKKSDAPVAASKKVTSADKIVTLKPNDVTGASLEDALAKFLRALADGCEVVIRSRGASSNITDEDVPSSASTKRAPKAASVEEPARKPKSAPAKADKPKGVGTAAYVKAAYNAARSVLKKDSAYTKPSVVLAIAKELKAAPKAGKRAKPLAELGERGVMSCLLTRIKEMANLQAKAAPGASANDAREWAASTLKAARASAIAKAKAAREAKAAKK